MKEILLNILLCIGGLLLFYYLGLDNIDNKILSIFIKAQIVAFSFFLSWWFMNG